MFQVLVNDFFVPLKLTVLLDPTGGTQLDRRPVSVGDGWYCDVLE